MVNVMELLQPERVTRASLGRAAQNVGRAARYTGAIIVGIGGGSMATEYALLYLQFSPSIRMATAIQGINQIITAAEMPLGMSLCIGIGILGGLLIWPKDTSKKNPPQQ